MNPIGMNIKYTKVITATCLDCGHSWVNERACKYNQDVCKKCAAKKPQREADTLRQEILTLLRSGITVERWEIEKCTTASARRVINALRWLLKHDMVEKPSVYRYRIKKHG